MVQGIGIDILEIDNITKSIEMSSKFIERVFTSAEIEHCNKQCRKHQHYATRFAAKEAVMKALGVGWSEGIGWKEIEILRENNSPPTVILHGTAKKIADNLSVTNILVSLSHSDHYATAMVVIEV